jgi:hypothetical protein
VEALVYVNKGGKKQDQWKNDVWNDGRFDLLELLLDLVHSVATPI